MNSVGKHHSRDSLPFTRRDSSLRERKGIVPTLGSGGAAPRPIAALANGRMKTAMATAASIARCFGLAMVVQFFCDM